MKLDLSQMITVEDKAAEAAKMQQATARAEATAYLAETDWLIVRRAETGKSVPRAVLDKRKAARDLLTLE